MTKKEIKLATDFANKLLETNREEFETLFNALSNAQVAAVFEKEGSTKIDFFIESSNIDLEAF